MTKKVYIIQEFGDWKPVEGRNPQKLKKVAGESKISEMPGKTVEENYRKSMICETPEKTAGENHQGNTSYVNHKELNWGFLDEKVINSPIQ